MNTQTQEALEKIERRLRADNLDEWSLTALADIAKEALATNKESSLVQPAQEPISFEMDELTEEWYGVLDDKTALIIYGGNRGYWSNKIYTHSTPDSTPDSTPAHQWQGLTNEEINLFIFKHTKFNVNIKDDFETIKYFKNCINSIEQALKDKNT